MTARHVIPILFTTVSTQAFFERIRGRQINSQAVTEIDIRIQTSAQKKRALRESPPAAPKVAVGLENELATEFKHTRIPRRC
jgi:hypothetical protein